MRITLTINDTQVKAELYDHPVANELAERLPLDLVFNDFNNVEKVAVLNRSLTLRDVPDVDAPFPGEIGYHHPSRGLALYYNSPGRWPGLVRMGHFDYDLDALGNLPDGSRIYISSA